MKERVEEVKTEGADGTIVKTRPRPSLFPKYVEKLSLSKALRFNNAPEEKGGDSEDLRQVKRRVQQRIKDALLQTEPTTKGERGTDYYFVPDLWAAVDALNKPETLAGITEKYFDFTDMAGRGGYQSVEPWIEMLSEVRAAIPEMTNQYRKAWLDMVGKGDLLEGRYSESINAMNKSLEVLNQRLGEIEEEALASEGKIEEEEGSDLARLKSVKNQTDADIKAALAAYTRRLRAVKESELEDVVEDLAAPLGQLLGLERTLRNNVELAVGAMEVGRSQASERPQDRTSDKEISNRTLFPNLEDVDTKKSKWIPLSTAQEQMKTKIFNLLEPKGYGEMTPDKSDPGIISYMSQTLGTKFRPEHIKAGNGQMTVYLPPSNTGYVIGTDRKPWMDAAALGWIRENIPEWEGGAEVRSERVRKLVGPTSMGLDSYSAQVITRKQIQEMLTISDPQATRVVNGLKQIQMFDQRSGGIVYDDVLNNMEYDFSQDGELADVLTGVMQSAGVGSPGLKGEKLRKDVRAAMKDWLRGYASLETEQDIVDNKLALAVSKGVLNESEAEDIKKKL